MTDALLLPQLLIAGVLIVAGVAKIRTPSDVQAGFVAMRVSARLSGRLIRTVFPWGETLLGVFVLACWGWPLAVFGAVAAGLMASYLGLVGRVVRSGQRPECACFGTFSAGVVGWSTVIRNTLLMVGALGVVIQGAAGGGLVPWLAGADSSACWWLAMAAFVVLAVGSVLYTPASQRLAASEGSGARAADDGLDYMRLPIPYVALETNEGEISYLREMTRTGPLLLVFVSFSCSSCLKTLERLPQWRRELGIEVRPVVDRNGHVPADAPEDLLFDRNREAMRSLELGGTPSAVLLGADGLLAGGPVVGAAAIRQLVEDVSAQLSEAQYSEGAERDQPADEAADQEVLGHRVDSQA